MFNFYINIAVGSSGNFSRVAYDFGTDLSFGEWNSIVIPLIPSQVSNVVHIDAGFYITNSSITGEWIPAIYIDTPLIPEPSILLSGLALLLLKKK